MLSAKTIKFLEESVDVNLCGLDTTNTAEGKKQVIDIIKI